MSPAPHNPYRPDRLFAGQETGHRVDPHEKTAPGLTADDLDRLLRQHFARGHREATLELERQMEERFPVVYDEGFDAGWGAGRANADEAVRASLRREIGRLTTVRAWVDNLLGSPKTTIAHDRGAVEEIRARLDDVYDALVNLT